MRKITFLPLFLWLFALIYGGTVSASSYTVTSESDWYFTIDNDSTLVVIYGNSNESCDEVTTDPHLWLYDDNPESTGQLIAQDDDGNHNQNDQCVSSKIYTTLNAGDYRLRAGYCCSQLGLGNTMSWGDGTYELITEFSLESTATPTTTAPTTTTVPQSIGPPMNLTGEITESGVYLNWDAPNTGNVEPERYAIAFRIPPNAGWGIATGNVGDENALNTEYLLPFSLFENTGGLDETYVLDVRSDNDTLGLYSGWSTQVELLVSTPTPSPTTTTTTWPSTTTTTTLPPVLVTTTVPSTTTTTAVTSTTTTTTTTTLLPTTTSSSTTTVPPTSSTTSTTSSTSTTTTTTTTLPPPPPSTTSTTTTTTALPTTTTSTTTTTSSTSTTVPSTSTSSTSTTTTTEVPKPRITEQESAIIERITNKELAESVTEVLSDDGEITVEVLHQVIDNEDFESLDEETLAAVSEALSEAPEEVKEEFEAEVNVFSGSFDNYVPSGSNIDVGERRTLVAVTATVSAAAAAPAGGGRRRR